jgi:HAD superfamily phosphoserine phosphatase-like hydrolase
MGKIAFVDFDGTLYLKDSYIEFIKFVRGNWGYRLGLIILLPIVLAHFLGLVSNQRLKEIFFRKFLGEIPNQSLTQLGEEFSLSKIDIDIDEVLFSKVLKLKNDGYHIVILTASSSIWLNKWCAKEGFELVGTKFKNDNGFFTGQIDGRNVHGMEKRRIVNEYLTKNHYNSTIGFGDSKSDLYYLKLLHEYKFIKRGPVSKILNYL